MESAYTAFSTRKTPQTEPVPGKQQVRNSAGGYVFNVGDWKRLDRFLVLGSEKPTYYASAQELTRQNAEAVLRCIGNDGPRVVARIVEISQAGRAPKNDPALFALAMAMKLGDLETRQAAAQALPKVARIGTHLFHFAQFVEQFGGWGKLTRQAVAAWYNDKDIDKLAYQAVKYQQRDGWSHRDLLRLAHPKPVDDLHDALYYWAVGQAEGTPRLPLPWVDAYERAKTTNENETVRLIHQYGLTREMVQTQHLNSARVWAILLEKMPLTAMIRNLGKMTSIGLLKPFGQVTSLVTRRLTDQEYLRRSRVHPLQVLVALKIYAQGKGLKGSLSWSPVTDVIDALDEAFYLSFGNVKSAGKRWCLALDVSGSMGWGDIAGMPLTPREASAAMALVTARTEPHVYITAFSHELVGVNLSRKERLDDVIRKVSRIPMGRTNCALPMIDALRRHIEVDTFVVITDNETWASDIHPFQALQRYRREVNDKAKLVVVGMTATEFSIADPDDGGMLDVVGFDTATPQVISDFVTS